MARQGYPVRLQGAVQGAVQDIKELKKGTTRQTQPDNELPHGRAVVQEAVALGNGCICDILTMSGSEGGGRYYSGARCHGAMLKAGDQVQFQRMSDGTIELIAGGGGGPTTQNITNNNTYINQDGVIYCTLLR